MITKLRLLFQCIKGIIPRMWQIFRITLIIIFFIPISCDKGNNKREKTLESIDAYIKNAFFVKNYDFNTIEIKIVRAEDVSVDSLIRFLIKAKKIRLLNETEEENPGTDFQIWKAKWEAKMDKDERIIYLNSIRSNYSLYQMGQYISIFIKGKYNNNKGVSNNYLREDLEFILDDKGKIIYSILNEDINRFL